MRTSLKRTATSRWDQQEIDLWFVEENIRERKRIHSHDSTNYCRLKRWSEHPIIQRQDSRKDWREPASSLADGNILTQEDNDSAWLRENCSSLRWSGYPRIETEKFAQIEKDCVPSKYKEKEKERKIWPIEQRLGLIWLREDAGIRREEDLIWIGSYWSSIGQWKKAEIEREEFELIEWRLTSDSLMARS